MLHTCPARRCGALRISKHGDHLRSSEPAPLPPPPQQAGPKRRARYCAACRVSVRRIRETPEDDDDNSGLKSPTASVRRRFLLQYVTDVQPSVIDSFSTQAPPEVMDAMRHTVTNMVGSLPPQWFSLTVVSLSENLAQLLFSTVMTGYVFRNLARRRELKRMLLQPSAGSPATKTLPSTGRGQQRDVSGLVALPGSGPTDGKQLVPAGAYIHHLEREVLRLREELASVKQGVAGRELLDDLQALEPANLTELTSSADQEVLDAMNTFVKRLVDVDAGNAGARSTTSVPELARLLSWCLIVGYALRSNQEAFDVGATLA